MNSCLMCPLCAYTYFPEVIPSCSCALQVERLIRFDDKVEALLQWDLQIQDVCTQVRRQGGKRTYMCIGDRQACSALKILPLCSSYEHQRLSRLRTKPVQAHLQDARQPRSACSLGGAAGQ